MSLSSRGDTLNWQVDNRIILKRTVNPRRSEVLLCVLFVPHDASNMYLIAVPEYEF